MELNKKILEILNKRGFSTKEEIEEFLSDKPQKTYDPFLLHDMEAGVDLILSTVENGDKICIYGDYDTDGVTSVVLLRDVLKEIGADVTYYIPSRFDEGYGLNNSALDKIKSVGTKLVITVDCGCTSVAEAKHAKELGMDILITDHHAIRDEIPDCLVIDPQHPDCNYPFKYLAGVGVAFKLCQALLETVGMNKSILTRNLDLVGIGTIGDIVPLVDENRTLAKYGLRALNITERVGLRTLIEKTGLVPGSIKSQSVSFTIVPHINAAGRMKEATLAARLMHEKDPDEAEKMTEKLIECNSQRKNVQNELVKNAEKVIAELESRELSEGKNTKDNHFVFVNLEEAHEGVIGIVAGKIKDKYQLPTIIVAAIEDGFYKGTGRSPDGINLFQLLNGRDDLFVRFGGHAAACGFTIEASKIDELISHLKSETDSLYEKNRAAFDFAPKAESYLEAEDVTLDFIHQQEKFEPFGKSNPRPLVELEIGKVKCSRIGKEGQFLRMDSCLKNGQNLRCLDFKNADNTETKLKAKLTERDGLNDSIIAIGYLDSQEWNGREYIQLKLEEIK